jgi:lysozyme
MTLAIFGGCVETHNVPPSANVSVPVQVAEVTPLAVPVPVAKPEARPADAWSTNPEAIKIIEDAEGLRLRAYRLAGQWLIGYGHATDASEEAVQDLTITENEAAKLLRSDVGMCENAVRDVVKVQVTRNQFSALVAFCYNVGPATMAKSQIVRHLNNGECDDAAEAFLAYDHARMEDEKVKVASLTQRRIKERYLFLAS